MLFRRAKQQYFSSLDLSLIADNKKFWKTVKPLFSDKISHKDIISLTEDGKTITEDLPIAEIFNNYFSNVIRSLCDRNVPTEPGIACSQNTVSAAINKFRNHPSILSINKNMERIGRPSFAFEFVSLEETIKEVNKLSVKKASQTLNMLVKIIKENKDLISYFVYNNFNNVLSSSQLIEKWRQSLDPGGQTAAVLTDLSKAFDYIDLTFIYSYLSERKQRTRINSSVKDVVGQRYYLVYPKVLSWDHVY